MTALTLAKEFDTDVNGLPLSFAISWFEQKVRRAVCGVANTVRVQLTV
jgi:hydroxylamine reductase (hybrid-cluster protein)